MHQTSEFIAVDSVLQHEITDLYYFCGFHVNHVYRVKRDIV